MDAVSALEVDAQVACPSCGSWEQVHKVHHLIAAGPTQGQPGPFPVQTTRKLRHQLRELPEPRARTHWLMIAGLVLLSVALLWFGLSQWIWLVAGGAFLGLVVGLKFWHTRQQRHYVQATHPAWEQAHQRWLRLYYCGHCQGVFLSDEGFMVSVEDLQPYLYQNDVDTLRVMQHHNAFPTAGRAFGSHQRTTIRRVA